MAAWVHGSWPPFPVAATWISNTYLTDGTLTAHSWRKFVMEFDIPWYATPTGGSITINSDNAEAVYVNGVLIHSEGYVTRTDAHADDTPWTTVLTASIPAASLAAGTTNKLEVIVKNYTGIDSPYSNPTGLIYSMVISYDLPASVQAEIDIKPGSWPNSINLCSGGLVPVAIFSTADFDATEIDPTTVTLAGAEVAVRGKGKSMAHEEDVNGDGLTDLVVQVETEGFVQEQFISTYAILSGALYDGTTFWGYDELNIVKEECP